MKINKNRIIFMLTFTFLAIIFYMAESSNPKKTEVIETMSMPVTTKTIVLDAGHRTEKMEVQ